ncbi:two component sensor histidine kinase [Neokomagataea thailandica NBRC 106555]|uniref:histidine kinase n=2 Tax=Neokomagataea TaxID=1223423 RepID=A0A4Y6V4U9_9PROT|nr:MULTISPECIES: ATP-binding protein [Neokomagataea]QDH24374.1 HAMP domain-containing protein [Neokomagataea tanensis]GBR53304.1 two component sensor histidine kinase [Neokomagataea thailandica NBRC 106555]
MRLLPSSLVTRTSLLLIVGLAIVELTSLFIHAMDRLDTTERAELHNYQLQTFTIYCTFAQADPDDRAALLKELNLPDNLTVLLLKKPDPNVPNHPIPLPGRNFPAPGNRLDGRADERFQSNAPLFNGPPPGMGMEMPRPENMPMPDNMQAPQGNSPMRQENSAPPRYPFPDQDWHGPAPQNDNSGGPFMPSPPNGQRPEEMESQPNFIHSPPRETPLLIRWALLPRALYPLDAQGGSILRTRSTSLLLPDGKTWVVVRLTLDLPNPFGTPGTVIAFLITSLVGSTLIVWSIRRMMAPVETLASAAEALGRDMNSSAASLPETGPSELQRASIAFNTMARRIQRFVTDRTLMLTAIGHDLRTPITRLKLRAEFIDDDELRTKVLADLDEMEAMVSSTLAFGRDSSANEPLVSLDLRALLETIVDEAIESQPQKADSLHFTPPNSPVEIRARSVALKRALNNLILNALKYGGSAIVTLTLQNTGKKQGRHVRILIEDNGPGLSGDDLERVFEPFFRTEASRNCETGGTGLGLSIARTILRGQGGDVYLENRKEGGLRAVVTLAL